MATLNANTVTDGSSNITARAWVNFNFETTPTIRKAYNVNSLTRNGTGDYTVTFSITFADANYVTLATGQDITAGTNTSAPSVGLVDSGTASPTTTAVRLSGVNATGSAVIDFPTCNVLVFR